MLAKIPCHFPRKVGPIQNQESKVLWMGVCFKKSFVQLTGKKHFKKKLNKKTEDQNSELILDNKILYENHSAYLPFECFYTL